MSNLFTEVKKINVQEDDIIIVKSNDVTMEQLQRLYDSLKDNGVQHKGIFKLNIEDDIQSMNEAQMNAAGWYRKE